MIKKRKLKSSLPVKEIFDRLKDAGLIIAPVDDHVSLIADSFGDIHRDPFDRMIAATAIVNNSPLITADRKLFQYPIEVIRV